jgi:GGDEF domain-containing protein
MEKNVQILRPLIYAIELRDHYTKGHSERVGIYAEEFGKFLGLETLETEKLYISGLLHDIGKIAIPDNILLKPSLLTVKEYDVIKYHPVLSADLVKNIDSFKELVPVIKHHHENYDGSGYPDKLKGDEIPFLSRILSIVDVFDALSTDRIYREAFSLEESLGMMKDMKYKFDPKLLEKFFVFIKEFGLYREKGDLIEEKELQKIRKLREKIFFEDMLTGLLNRNALMLLIKKAISLNKSVSLIKFEIKNFKLIHQKRGIITADKIIKLTASEIKNRLDIKFNPESVEDNDVYAVRDSGGRFLFLVIGESGVLFGKLNVIEDKILPLFEGVEYEKDVLIENRRMDYNFEKVIEYIL